MNDEQKTVTLKESEFKEILARLQGLEQRDGPGYQPVLRNAIKERLVTVLFIEDKPVIGYANKGTDASPTYIYEAPDPNKPTDMMLYVDVILKGETMPVRLGYTEFLREASRKECLVKKIIEEPWEIEQGRTEVVTVPEGKYYATATGIVVPVEVKGVIRSYLVSLPDGSELLLHERYVNIAK